VGLKTLLHREFVLKSSQSLSGGDFPFRLAQEKAGKKTAPKDTRIGCVMCPIKDPCFKTERERRFYKAYWIVLWLLGATIAIVGICRLLIAGSNDSWVIILTGISLPLFHDLYEHFGLALAHIGIAIYERVKSRR
jgi:hypothetical protein